MFEIDPFLDITIFDEGVDESNVDELLGGAFHCATLDVRRRGTLESYF